MYTQILKERYGMEINGDIIFYWLRMQYPNITRISRGDGYSPKVHNAVYYSKKSQQHGHFVLIDACEIVHNVRLNKYSIYCCVGDPVQELPGEVEWFVINNVPVKEFWNRLVYIFEVFDSWENALEQAVSTKFSFHSIISSCDNLIWDPMALTDDQFHYIGYSKIAAADGHEENFVDVNNYVPLDVINIVTADPQYSSLAEIKDAFHHVSADDLLHKNVYYKDEYVGRLSIPFKTDEALNNYYSEILRTVAYYVELLYKEIGTFWHRQRQNSRFKEMLMDIMAGVPVEQNEFTAVAREQEYNQGDECVCIQLRSNFTENHEKLNRILETQLEETWPGTTCLCVDSHFYIILNTRIYNSYNKEPFTQALAVFLRESLLIAGVSRTFASFTDFQIAVRQTEVAIDFGCQKDSTYWYFMFDNYALDYLLQKGYSGFRPKNICSQVVCRLKEYDEENGTDLNETLKLYMKNHFNAVATAKELYLARSSFLKRLDRITELTGLDWNDERELGYITISNMIFDAV